MTRFALEGSDRPAGQGSIPVLRRKSSRNRSAACCRRTSVRPVMATEKDGVISIWPEPGCRLEGKGMSFGVAGDCAYVNTEHNIRSKSVRMKGSPVKRQHSGKGRG